jgi:hypothetical protein
MLIPMLKRRSAKLAWNGELDSIVQQDSGKPNLIIAESTSCYHGRQRCNECIAERLLTPQASENLRAIYNAFPPLVFEPSIAFITIFLDKKAFIYSTAAN